MSNPTTENQVSHCKDCCCARSWDALGITEFTGLSIPEHIRIFREALEQLEELGKEGMKPNPNEWLTFHDKVAQIAHAALDARLTP